MSWYYFITKAYLNSNYLDYKCWVATWATLIDGWWQIFRTFNILDFIEQTRSVMSMLCVASFQRKKSWSWLVLKCFLNMINLQLKIPHLNRKQKLKEQSKSGSDSLGSVLFIIYKRNHLAAEGRLKIGLGKLDDCLSLNENWAALDLSPSAVTSHLHWTFLKTTINVTSEVQNRISSGKSIFILKQSRSNKAAFVVHAVNLWREILGVYTTKKHQTHSELHFVQSPRDYTWDSPGPQAPYWCWEASWDSLDCRCFRLL